MVNGIVWVTPRRSLQAQAVESAAEGPDPKKGIPGFRIGDNHRNPTRQGFATNFASLLRNPKEHLAALKAVQGPVLLVADEIHFLRGGTEIEGWSEAFAALRKEVFDRGGHQLSMTGTARRWDENPVVNTPYDPDGIYHLNKAEVISYTREDGLADDAIVKIQPQTFDGPVQWEGPDGLGTPSPELLSSFGDTNDPRLMGRALRAFLSVANLNSVHVPVVWDALTRPRRGWLSQLRVYGNNQIIVMVDRQETAVKLTNILNSTEFRTRLRRRSHDSGCNFNDDFRALLAVSSDSWSCRAISSYRSGKLLCNFAQRKVSDGFKINGIGKQGQAVHCLVTVGMASVGMDAPACTHLVNLGVTRSIPWLTQALARSWRAGSYRWPSTRPRPLPVCDRRAFVWMPDDVRMQMAFLAVCDGTYAAGLAKNQLSEGWHLLPDPADTSDGLDSLEPKEKKDRDKEPNKRPEYIAIPGSCGVTSFTEHQPV